MDTSYTSNISSNINNIDKYIEENIEKKINQLLVTLPNDINNIKINYSKYTIIDLYKGTIQTIIDIINDITTLMVDRNYIGDKNFRERLFNIFLDNDRRLFIGIILIILSFILYFIDGVST